MGSAWRARALGSALFVGIVLAFGASTAFAATSPSNTVLPSLSGTAQDGKTLTASKGTWSGTTPINYTYQWQESTNGGSTWSAISGATATTYTPPAGSAGELLDVVVTATNSAGTGQATSAASAALLSGPPVETVLPSLSGTAQDGVALTAGKGTWTGAATIVYTYQWQSSSNAGVTWSSISGATGSSYTPPAGSAGQLVDVVVTATNGDGTAQGTSPASAAILSNPPVETVLPSVSGTAQDGQKLTAGKGTWLGMATISYTYQWQSSTNGGLSWSPIAGATASSYTLPAGSAGQQIDVVVTATNGDGTAQATSPATAVVLASPPVNTVLPSLSGTAEDGDTLRVTSGTWTGVATITYAYQWQSSSDGGATWSSISGATGSSYTPPAGSAGEQVDVVVTATNGDGTVQATSPASAVVVGNPPVDTVLPSVSGTAQDGVRLTAGRGTWTGLATISYGYQWQSSSDGGVTWSPIPGATATTYTLPAGSAGEEIDVVVTATNGDGVVEATSPATAAVLASPPVDTVAPSISGTAQDGVKLTAAKGTWSGIATIAYAYQWQESSDGGATWTPLAGATASTYTPPAGSAGEEIDVVVTATNGDGTVQATSPASAAVLANAPVNSGAPSLSGTAEDGLTLTAAKGTWTGMATITYAYQWQSSSDGGATWSSISGATGSSYTPPAGSAGQEIEVVVTGTNADGSVQAASAPSAALLANVPVNVSVPTLSGTAEDGATLTAASGTWTGLATISYGYQWQSSSDGGATWTAISGATSATYTPPGGSAGEQLEVVVTATNGDGSSQASSTASAAVLGSPPVNSDAPSVSGTAQVGSSLTATSGTWTGVATVTYAYQWDESSDGGVTWSPISGATATTYSPAGGSVGEQLEVIVTATNGDGSSQATSPATASILAAPSSPSPSRSTSSSTTTDPPPSQASTSVAVTPQSTTEPAGKRVKKVKPSKLKHKKVKLKKHKPKPLTPKKVKLKKDKPKQPVGKTTKRPKKKAVPPVGTKQAPVKRKHKHKP